MRTIRQRLNQMARLEVGRRGAGLAVFLAAGLVSSLGLGKLGGPPVGVLERLPAKLVPTEEALCHVRVGDRAEGGRLLLAPSRLLLLLLPPLGRRLVRVRARVRVRV